MSASIRGGVLTLAVLAATPLMAQGQAMANQSSVTVVQPSTSSIAPGASGLVNLVETNSGPSASFSTLSFTAPTGATFADTNLYFDNEPVKFVSCALSSGNAVMTCSADGALEFPTNSSMSVGVDVRVPSSAAPASMLGGGSMSVPSVSPRAWPFGVSTARNGSVKAPTAPGAPRSTVSPGPKGPAGQGTDGDGATNLVPPSFTHDHHCQCGPEAAQAYIVKMLATEYIRSGPSTGYPAVGSVTVGTHILVTCKVDGQIIDGNPRWYQLYGHPGWISARWAEDLSGIPPFCP